MSNKQRKLDKPIHPGFILAESFLLARCISVADAAAAIGIKEKELAEFLAGKRRCSANFAKRIAIATNTTVEHWLDLQNKLDVWVANNVINVKGVKSLVN